MPAVQTIPTDGSPRRPQFNADTAQVTLTDTQIFSDPCDDF